MKETLTPQPLGVYKRVEDITQTTGYKKAMDDVKHGRVTEYASLKDFYKEMGALIL